MKTEIWNGHAIRFVEKEPGEWWAVADDIAKAMGFRDALTAARYLPDKYKGITEVSTPSCDTPKERITSGKGIEEHYTTSGKIKARETQDMIIISEKGLYRLIMRSNKPEAEAFQDWVFEVIKELRQASGLEGFQVFRLMDKEHQKDAMRRLRDGLHTPVRVDFIKANVIANKAVSTLCGHPRALKKEQMTPNMLTRREPILEDTVNLMTANDSFKLGLSVSGAVYAKYGVNIQH